MKRYRIKEVRKGSFVIEQRFCFIWVDVSTPHPAFAPHVAPLTSVEQAQARIDSWRVKDAFVPRVYPAR